MKNEFIYFILATFDKNNKEKKFSNVWNVNSIAIRKVDKGSFIDIKNKLKSKIINTDAAKIALIQLNYMLEPSKGPSNYQITTKVILTNLPKDGYADNMLNIVTNSILQSTLVKIYKGITQHPDKNVLIMFKKDCESATNKTFGFEVLGKQTISIGDFNSYQNFIFKAKTLFNPKNVLNQKDIERLYPDFYLTQIDYNIHLVSVFSNISSN